MQRAKATIRLITGSILLGLAVTLASTLRKSELNLSFDLPMRPCIISSIVFPPFPVKQTDYGFPAYWLSKVEMASMIGCGPILKRYVTYSLSLPGFLIDTILYGICSGALLHLTSRLRAKRNRGLPD
jgi:hypothetical protein